MFDYYRGLVAGSEALAGGNLLYALELFHDDGPWDDPDGYEKVRLLGEPAGPDEGGFDDVHVHPVYPISARIALTARF